jgi:hypothetical protein
MSFASRCTHSLMVEVVVCGLQTCNEEEEES